MKGLCTVASGEVCNFIVHGKKQPAVGSHYILEPIVDKGTAKQNRTLHPLIDCLFSWMLERNTYQFEDNGIEYDFRCSNKDKLKTIFKIKYGNGADSWEFVNDKLAMVEIFDLKDLPSYVIDDFQKGNKGRIKAVHAISWAEYNKKERMKLIDATINIMKTIGVDSIKFYEILEGIKSET